jgi:hypothetical protein
MMRLRAAWLVGGALLMCVPRPTLGQAYVCLPDTAHELYAYVVRLVTATDPATVSTRNTYHLPAVNASKVAVVSTPSVCTQAGGAYHAAVSPTGTPPISRTLLVIKVGNTRYVVVDPNEQKGEFGINIVFDSQWQVLFSFTS